MKSNPEKRHLLINESCKKEIKRGAVRNYESYENHFGLTFILQLKSQHLYSSEKLSSA